ncbi:MAG: hypothetical protein CMJ58_17705 [Planctomycetaceae bacterium]|nr:hypothetical protein [Planctomycetaceae bacterium]
MTTATEALPAARDAEQYLVGAMLRDPTLIASVAKRVTPGDIVDPAHREAVRELIWLDRNGEPVDPAVLNHKLKANRAFSKAAPDSFGYLIECGNACATTAHLDYYAGRVVEASRKRRLYDIAQTAAEHAQNGKASTDVLADLLSDIEDMRREFVNTQRFRTLTAAELDGGDFAVEFLVAWLLVKGQPCILAGGKKSLKTTLLIALGLALATGSDFLGLAKFRVHGACKFLLCSGESGLGTIQETSRRIAKWMGWELGDVPNFIVTDDLPQLDSDSDLSEFSALLERTEADVVAIDPAYLCLGGDDHGNLFKQGALLLRLSRLCSELGVTLILCHHTRKNRGQNVDAFDPPELEDIAWAGFQEFARQWLLVGRREQFEPGSGVHRLWLNVGGSVGHGGLWAVDVTEGSLDDPGGRTWDVSIAKASEAREAAQQRKDEAKAKRQAEQLEDDRRAIADYLVARTDRTDTKTAIKAGAGLNDARFAAAIAAAIKLNAIETTTTTKANGQTYDAFRLLIDDPAPGHPDASGQHPDK